MKRPKLSDGAEIPIADIAAIVTDGIEKAVAEVISRIRQCECGVVFLKTYRREFCSVQCQKRVNARKQRQTAREQRER